VASTNTHSNNPSNPSPTIPALHNTPPRQVTSANPPNPYLKPSPNFKTTGDGSSATVIRTVPSSVKYRQLAPIEYEPQIAKHLGLFPSGAVFAEPAPLASLD
jgi:hypothetical protein